MEHDAHLAGAHGPILTRADLDLAEAEHAALCTPAGPRPAWTVPVQVCLGPADGRSIGTNTVRAVAATPLAAQAACQALTAATLVWALDPYRRGWLTAGSLQAGLWEIIPAQLALTAADLEPAAASTIEVSPDELRPGDVVIAVRPHGEVCDCVTVRRLAA